MKKLIIFAALVIAFASCTKHNDFAQNIPTAYLQTNFTVEQSNVSHYIIQTSTDGYSFSDATVIFATDNPIQTYSNKIDITHLATTSPVVYSRIKSVDKDGAISYTNVFTNRYNNK